MLAAAVYNPNNPRRRSFSAFMSEEMTQLAVSSIFLQKKKINSNVLLFNIREANLEFPVEVHYVQ